MSLSQDEWAILDDNSDDWYGLWEVDWWFNGAHPDWPFERRLALLSDLVRRGLMEIFFGPLGKESPALEGSVALDAISNPMAWLPRSGIGDPVYHVATSASGRSALAGLQGI